MTYKEKLEELEQNLILAEKDFLIMDDALTSNDGFKDQRDLLNYLKADSIHKKAMENLNVFMRKIINENININSEI